MNLDLSKASGPDCIPVVVLKNFEPQSVVPAFKNVGESSTAKNYHPVSLLSVIESLSKPCK